MAQLQENSSVTIEATDGGWHVQVVENGLVSEQHFETEEAAEDFASSQRMLLGLVPQQDIA